MKEKKALVVVNLQSDFCSGGTVEVPGANEIIPVVNELLKKFNLIIFSMDWHPHDYKLFTSYYFPHNDIFRLFSINKDNNFNLLWPDHCIENNPGADIHPDVKFENINGKFYFFKKGINKRAESYSAFYNKFESQSTGLNKFLKKKKITKVFICGLLLDYDVLFTAIDAKNLGYDTYVIMDAVKPLFFNSSDIKDELIKNNISIINSSEI